jgi:hypothetical protein
MDDEDVYLPPNPYASMPKEIREWCYNEIKDYVTYYDVEYPDNFRYADIGEPDQLEAYEEARLSGCCGEGEFQRTGPDGKTYMLGFNWGH